MIFKDHHNYEPGYYMIVIWIGLCFFTGILLLIIAVHKLKSIKKALMPFIFLAVYGILTVFLNTMSNMGIKIRLFQFPEVSVFCMMGIFEGCIRSGLIPTNNYHEELFEMMNIEAIITDRSLATHFTTRQVSDIDTDILKKAVNAPVYIDDNTRLSCNPIRAGYIFWTDDMRTIRSINDNLSRINEELEHENELKQAENDIREKNAHIAHQNRLYSMISRLMLPYEKKVEMLLDKADPLSDDFPQVVAEVSFLNAYIKRKTNLILISSGQNKISCRELYLALEESSRYFSCSGVLAQVNLTDDFMIGSDIAIVLYDTFQMILEKVYGQVSYMMTYLYDGHLRITSDFDAVPDLSDLPLKYMAGIEDNILFIDLSDELKEDLL